jgi:GNAT superfamily N-acetyltransferase
MAAGVLANMVISSIKTRSAAVADLDDINRVIDAAVLSWDLPERVKRLSLPTYRYTELDLQTIELVVAEQNDYIVGVAGWEQADPNDLPGKTGGLLLHGIYVDPAYHHRGIGSLLFKAAEHAAAQRGDAGLLVKAQSGATDFFVKQGMRPVAVKNPGRDYAHRYWKALT